MVKLSASGIKYIALLLAILLSTPAYAEILKVTGRVQDQEGEPLIGVTVVQKDDPKNGVVTDINGTYNLSIKRGATIKVSYVGYEPEEKKANATTIDFILKENVQTLDEVVVTGYATQKKISVLGAQSTLKMEHVKAPVSNMTNVLAGRVAGVVAVQRTGLPGQDDADIWIRGLSTLTNRNEGPLVLVDGIERSFSQLDPEDIESITVLKDAASTAVYGVRGGNGVIIITTKPGVAGTPKFSFDIYQGITQLTKVPSLVDGIDYMNCVNEAYRHTKGGAIFYSPNYITNTKIANGYPLTADEQAYAASVAGDPTINKYLYPSVNWMDEMYHKYGYNGRYNVNIRGGAPNATYYVSLSYYNEKGMTKKDPSQDYSSEITYDRYNFLTNINLKATKTTKVDIGVNGWITGGNYPEVKIKDIFEKAMQTNPVIYPVQYPNGENPGISPNNRELDSPWVTLTRRGYQTQNHTQVNTNLKLTQDLGFWKWSKGLEARALVSFDVRANQEVHYKVDDSTWAPTATQDPTTGTWVNDEFLYDADGNILLAEKFKGNNSMSVESDKWVYRTFYLEAALTYNRQFERKHNVNAMALFTMRSYLDANDSDLFKTLPHKQQSVALRASYDFDRRYFVEFNGGYTGSENFLKGHRFGFFPAVAAGWVPSNESWWSPLSSVVSFLKLRYSYGVVGNDSSDGRFTYFAKLNHGDLNFTNYWTSNGASRRWYYSSYGYEPMWSRVHKHDLGIELNLFNTDLSIVVDLFKEKRDHIFVERTDLPFLAGLEANPYANIGVVENKGFEISAEYTRRFGDDWLISLRGNMTYNQDKVIDNAQADPAYPWLDRRGHNVLASWGYIAEGLYTSTEQIKERGITQFGETYPGELVKPGDIMYKDLNGDGHIDDYDQTCISRGDIPQIYYGFGGDFRYKNIGLGLLFQGTAKADRLLDDNGIKPFQSSSGGGTLYDNISDRWSEENPEKTDVFYPRLAWGATDPSNENNFKTSTWWKKDMSFLRLKQFTVSFYFPKAWQKSVFKGGRFYLMGENVFTFSKFKLWDPELNTSNGMSYPNVRTFSIGVNFNL